MSLLKFELYEYFSRVAKSMSENEKMTRKQVRYLHDKKTSLSLDDKKSKKKNFLKRESNLPDDYGGKIKHFSTQRIDIWHTDI